MEESKKKRRDLNGLECLNSGRLNAGGQVVDFFDSGNEAFRQILEIVALSVLQRQTEGLLDQQRASVDGWK